MKENRIPGPGRPFDKDVFRTLLVKRKDGQTTEEENEYIYEELIRNPKARVLFAAVQKAYPGEDLMPDQRLIADRNCRRDFWINIWKVACTSAVRTVVVAGCTLAMNHFFKEDSMDKWPGPRRTAAVTTKELAPQGAIHRLDSLTLSAIADTIRLYYKMNVVFDRPEVSQKIIWGGFYPNNKVEDLLERLEISHGIHYRIKNEKELHFK